MFLPPPPSVRHRKSALTILEALVLLIAASILAIVTVPVLLVKLGLKPEAQQPRMTAPAAEEKVVPTPIPLPSMPETPKLPPVGDPTKNP